MELSHINQRGEATMVDVSDKDITLREAGAAATVRMQADTLKLILSGCAKKGDVFATARIAGINGTKKTSELIPLCHVIPIEKARIDFDILSDTELLITSYVKCNYKTGVEMEALTAVSCAALTIYDMCKAVDKSLTISDIHLIRKSGGRSGCFTDKIVEQLSIKRKRGMDSCAVNKITMTVDKGIEGDIFSDCGDKQISLISSSVFHKIDSTKNYVCVKKFSPNIIFRGTNPHVGDEFRIGSAVIEITQVGRECHKICEASSLGESCYLIHNAVFAKVIKSGESETGDELIYV